MTPDELRAALARLGLSQQALARHWGVNPRTVRRWALGEQDIPPWVPFALAGTLPSGKVRAMAG